MAAAVDMGDVSGRWKEDEGSSRRGAHLASEGYSAEPVELAEQVQSLGGWGDPGLCGTLDSAGSCWTIPMIFWRVSNPGMALDKGRWLKP